MRTKTAYMKVPSDVFFRDATQAFEKLDKLIDDIIVTLLKKHKDSTIKFHDTEIHTLQNDRYVIVTATIKYATRSMMALEPKT